MGPQATAEAITFDSIRTSVLWKINTHIAKKWPEKVVKKSFIKEHSFVYRLYILFHLG